MLKKISPLALRPGMYVHEYGVGSFNDPTVHLHRVPTASEIREIMLSGTKAVFIDPALGLDPRVAIQGLAAPYDPLASAEALRREIHVARQSYDASVRILKDVMSLLQQARNLDISAIEPIVDEVSASVFRNAKAGPSLACLARDPDLEAHSMRVAFMAAALGVRLELSEETVKKLAAAGLLHDVGKLRIGALRKNPRHMRMHPVLGYKMLEASIHRDVLRAVLEHHERADGTGYPRGLSLEKIGDVSRIVGLANAYDRLLASGPAKESKEGHTPHTALSRLYLQSGAGFPVVEVAAFVRLLGVYPLGSLVRLHDGRYAVVVDVSEEAPLRPTMRIAFDARLKPIPSQIIAPFELEGENSPLQIKECLDPRPLRLDTERFIF